MKPCVALALFASASPLLAQVRVNPTGVSVSSMSATTVFLAYGGLRNQRPAEAFWCGELLPAAPAVGTKCDPRTLYGRLPMRYDLSALSTGMFTDIMSIPASVARAAYQAAVRGATSTFFYVRRFENLSGGPDEYVTVTCRLTGGGARVPLSLTDVHLQFGGDDALPFVAPGEAPPPVSARITYTGTGRLVGRWEVVLPGEELPSERDLLTEASLPPDERGAQRTFTELERFNVFLSPDGRIVLRGPDVRRLPTIAEGTYQILLRIEASDDREADSDLGAAGAGSGIVHNGGVAGFALPVLRYVVAGPGARTPRGSPGGLRLVEPTGAKPFGADGNLTVSWIPGASAAPAFYRVDFETRDGAPLSSALLPKTARRYNAPPWIVPSAASRGIRWRVIGLGADGSQTTASAWRIVRGDTTLSAPTTPPAPGARPR
jgi:hypothetical protein